jgi:hypothetical protein
MMADVVDFFMIFEWLHERRFDDFFHDIISWFR